MFKPIYPQPHTGARLRARDKKNWMGVRGDESRLVRCTKCGFICDPRRDLTIVKGSFAGKGVDLGSSKSSSVVVGGKEDTFYYNEPVVTGGCPNCGTFLYNVGNEEGNVR